MKRCKRCQKLLGKRRTVLCNSCGVHVTRTNKLKKLHDEVLGYECSICLYGGEHKVRMLEMHHVRKKGFRVNLRGMALSWKEITAEARKCVLVCCRCHKEIHEGLIKEKKVISTWKHFWKKRTHHAEALMKIRGVGAQRPKKHILHGEMGMYVRGCRCQKCKEANRNKMRRYRTK